MAMRIARSLVVGILLLPLGIAVASADDGPSRRLLTAPGRPPETIERIVNVAGRSVLVTVRGYAASADDARDFDALAASMPDRVQYDFGTNFGTYDTRGDIGTSGRELRDEIRSLVREGDFADVRIVSVSMGGVVVDEAFRAGLAARDGVKTWTTIASPLNGSATAAAVTIADRVVSLLGADAELDESLALVGANAHDPAFRQLAGRRWFRTPRGITFTQFHAALDPLVPFVDSYVPGHTVETVLPAYLLNRIFAHGGQLAFTETRDMIHDAVDGRPVRQSPSQSIKAHRLDTRFEELRALALAGLAIGLVVGSVLFAVQRRLRIGW